MLQVVAWAVNPTAVEIYRLSFEVIMFKKKEWKKGGDHPGATDLNRIENGIADSDAVIERIKQLPRLEDDAKIADVRAAYNALIDAVNGD